jgi:hypothetical protein
MKTFVVAAAAALIVSAAQDQNGFDTARDLYAAAAFEEALASLDRIDQATLRSPAEGRLVAEYRIFALYALQRAGDAEAAAEALIRRDPSSPLVSGDASPRIHAMFNTVRARVLPQLIRDHYQGGRTALEKKDFATAERELSSAARMLDAAAALKLSDTGLADLRVLVDGFLVLSKSQNAAPSPTAEPPAPLASSTPIVKLSTPAGSAPAAAKSVYDSGDKDVVPPVALQQRLPDVPISLHNSMVHPNRMLVINLTIDETGRVRRADIATPFNPVYDRMVTEAAAKWRYQPATRAGVPVSYVKALAVTVQ